MLKIVLLLLISIVLFGNNPKVYATLGDGIYDNIDNIVELKKVEEFGRYVEDIDEYALKVKSSKKDGFKIQNSNTNISKNVYLKNIRQLSKTNNFFIINANKVLLSAIKNDNKKLFSALIENKIIDTVKYKNEIVEYYSSHKDNLKPSKRVEDIINKDNLKKQKFQTKKSYSKESQEAQKIKRIRANDKKRQAEAERKIQKELDAKKAKIRENQKKELNH